MGLTAQGLPGGLGKGLLFRLVPHRHSPSPGLGQPESAGLVASTSSSSQATGISAPIAPLCGAVALIASRQIRRAVRRAFKEGWAIPPPVPPWKKLQEEAAAKSAEGFLPAPRKSGSITALEEAPIQIHSTVLVLESALVCESLRTLCRVLSDASGHLPIPVDSPDRTKRPIMDASLTTRALLRFVELRHGSNDDLTPNDLNGKCGRGLQVLLRKCRDYKSEVLAALDSRTDDVIRLIQAFYDQRVILSKFMGFFRAVIEKSIPDILSRPNEPLQRHISFLEPYTDMQPFFLYHAAREGHLAARLRDMEIPQLLEVTGGWMWKARSGATAPITTNKVRVVTLCVAQLPIDMPPELRAEWLQACIWASTPNLKIEGDLKLLEAKVTPEFVERADPFETLEMCLLLRANDITCDDTFAAFGKLVEKAFETAHPMRCFYALQGLQTSADPPYPEAFNRTIGRILYTFLERSTGEMVETLFEKWAAEGSYLPNSAKDIADLLLERFSFDSSDLKPGTAARTGASMVAVGVDTKRIAPLLDKLLGREAGWSLKQALPIERDPFEEMFFRSDEMDAYELGVRGLEKEFLLNGLNALGKMWQATDTDGVMSLQEAENALQLIGPDDPAAPREVSKAADLLALKLATGIPGRFETEISAQIRNWRTGASTIPLACYIAPFLVQAIEQSVAEGIQLPSLAECASHQLARSVRLLAGALNGEPLGLLSAEWSLAPFVGAKQGEINFAAAVASGAAAKTGAPQAVVKQALQQWVAAGGPVAGLSYRVGVAAVAMWEKLGARGKGLDALQTSYRWLLEESKDLPAEVANLEAKTSETLQGINLLLEALKDGVPPSFPALSRAREGVLADLGSAGVGVLIDAVAFAWADAVPGLDPNTAGNLFQSWWVGRESARATVELMTQSIVSDLRFVLQMRVNATWSGVLPTGSGTPSWRVEGKRRVTWFVPSEVVEEAYADIPENAPKEYQRIRGWIDKPETLARAKEKTNGRCMYCGSNADLRPQLVFPKELGGQELPSNLTVVCDLCQDMYKLLGTRRWAQVLRAEPDEAAQAWWKSQQEANRRAQEALDKLAPKMQESVDDLAPAPLFAEDAEQGGRSEAEEPGEGRQLPSEGWVWEPETGLQKEGSPETEGPLRLESQEVSDSPM